MRLAFLLLLLCFFRSVSAQPAELRIGLWVAADHGKVPAAATQSALGVRAFNEELAREICRRINLRCQMENVLFPDMLPAVEAGRLDLGFGNYLRTPEREQRVAFSDSIWNSSSRLLGSVEAIRRLAKRSGHAIRFDQLHGQRVGVVSATQQAAYVESRAGSQGLSVVYAKAMDELISLLRDGKVDFCLVPMLTAYDSLQREVSGRFEFVGPAMVDGGLGGSVHILLPKNRDSLRLAVNQALAAMRADGSYHRLMRRHFPFNLD